MWGVVMERRKVSVLIKKSSLVFDKYINQLLAQYNLSGSQFRILMLLYKSPDRSIRQADIETAFSMTNPTVTGLIHSLEKKGLVIRVANPEDKRSKLLTLTDSANSMKERFFDLANELEKGMTEELTESEVEILAELLQKVLKKHEG